MKILISPAKTMKPCPAYTTGTIPMFYKEAMDIRSGLIANEELSSIYKFDKQKTNKIKDEMLKGDQYPAIHYYSGQVFKQITTTNNLDLVYILDAMYGLLRATDLISYYRLDYIMMPSLYKVYKEKVNKVLEKEDFIINLASKEFSKMIDHPNMITIDFVVEKNGKLTKPSMQLKTCRGLFVNTLLDHPDIELKEVIVDGFIYDPTLSDSKNYIFKRRA